MAILLIDSQGGVYRSDITTGNITRLADYSQLWTDIAVLPNGKVFANTSNGLYELNLNTNAATLRATPSGFFNGLASDSQGRLYLGGSANEILVLSSTTFNTIRTIDLPAGVQSAGDIHINGDKLYYSTTSNRLLTIDLDTGDVIRNVAHNISSLYGLHSEGGKLYGLAGNDVYLIIPNTGAVTPVLELPASITVYGAATLAGVKVVGTAQDDVLQADPNGSKLYGRDGGDILIGSAVGDLLDGGTGRDYIHGRGGSDRMLGGTGRDVLAGGRGNDTMTGNADKDAFVFNSGDGRDRITDFQDDLDTLELSLALLGSGPKTVAALLNTYASNTAEGVLFDFGAKGTLLLAGVDKKADLADDILLV